MIKGKVTFGGAALLILSACASSSAPDKISKYCHYLGAYELGLKKVANRKKRKQADLAFCPKDKLKEARRGYRDGFLSGIRKAQKKSIIISKDKSQKTFN